MISVPYTHTHTHTNIPSCTQPLMQRVQAALGAQLTRQNEKLEIELREKVSCTIPHPLQKRT